MMNADHLTEPDVTARRRAQQGLKGARAKAMSRARTIADVPAGNWTRWLIVGFWVVVLAVAFPLSKKLTGAERNDAAAWLPTGAESTKVLDLQAHFQSPNIYPGVVVYVRPSGLTAADRAKAAADARSFAAVPGVVPGQVAAPIPAADGKAMQTVVQVNLGSQGWNKAARTVAAIRAITRADAHGLASYVTGPLGNAADTSNAASGIQSTLLYAAVAIVIVILLVSYRSPVLWLLPVLCSGVALITAEAVIYLLAVHAGLTVNEQTAGILDVLVFGASTDYALLIVARYREELRRHDRRGPAMAEALRRAGPAILASASTVIVALMTLSFAQLNSTKGLGPVLAIGVTVGMAAMLTLLPALLVSCPRGVFWPYRPGYGSPDPASRGLWARIGRSIASRPRMVWITTAMLLGVLALGLAGLKASGLTDAQSFRGHPDSVAGESVLAAHFPAGDGDPVIVAGDQRAAARLRAVFAGTWGIAAVTPSVDRAGHAYLEGTLTSPPDSQAARATVSRVRAMVHAVRGGHALVGGYTAVSLDEAQASAHDRNLIIPLILAVVFIILAVLLRALAAPLVLMATVVLSFAAALGVSAFFFTHVFGFGGVDTTFPLFVFVFLVALGIDYNIFLMTRVREETARHGARHGAITGLAATGGVITSAGFVLAGTFAALATISFTALTELGFAVAFGILLDTIVVRSVLVTALNLDLGRWMWWPSGLARQGAAAHRPAARELAMNQGLVSDRAGLAGQMTTTTLDAAGPDRLVRKDG
jgi:RND superfamily putative drug exporter